MMERPVWTDVMILRATAWRREGLLYSEIDDRLGVRRGSTATKLKRMMSSPERKAAMREVIKKWKREHPPKPRGSWVHSLDRPNNVPQEVLADRDARLQARDSRDITAAFFGDPPPGFSALDRIRARAVA